MKILKYDGGSFNASFISKFKSAEDYMKSNAAQSLFKNDKNREDKLKDIYNTSLKLTEKVVKSEEKKEVELPKSEVKAEKKPAKK